MEKLRSYLGDVDEILCFNFFWKSVEKTDVWLKSDKSKGVFYIKTYAHLHNMSLNFARMKNILDKILEKIKTHF